MTDSNPPSSPPLGSTRTPSVRPASIRSSHTGTNHSLRSQTSSRTTEETPLLAREDANESDGERQQSDGALPAAPSALRSLHDHTKGGRRWPSILALVLLCLVVIVIMALAFFAPAIVKEYAMQATTFEPTSLSIDSFTPTGVRARIEGDLTMDASRVKKKAVRDLGRFGTWVAKEVESGETDVEVTLPEYGNVVLGTATVPPIKISVRNGHTTHVNFLSDLQPGNVDGIRRVANDWLDGKLGQLRVQGKAKVPLKSGLLRLGDQSVAHSVVLEGDDIPSMPEYDILRLNFHENDLPGTQKGMAADVALRVGNKYPLDFTVPPLGFNILVDGCASSDPYIMLADATTGDVHIEPKEDLYLNVSGIVRGLPEALTQACPGSQESPLDALLGEYIHGNDTTIYVRGSDSPSPDTPKWITDLISGITVPVPFPGHTFDHLIRNFTLANVHFGLPDPFAKPGSPEAQPQISAKIKALVALPEEMNFNIDVGRVRADADVYYHGKKLGYLDLREWQRANSTRADVDGLPGLAVEAAIRKAPLQVTDDDIFSEVVQALVFGGKMVYLTVKAGVDVEMKTALGEFAVRKIPAEGVVPVKPISGGGIGTFAPKLGNLKILDTGSSSITLQAEVNVTNPTEYSATVPYIDINILNNGTILGHATAKDVRVVPGPNENILVTAVWDPLISSGSKGQAVGKEFLSQYISGWNSTITLKTHKGSIPSQPALGKALESMEIVMPTPKLSAPVPGHGDGDGGDDKDMGPHFIEDATMHLFTSSATFTLLSPLKYSTLFITYINATAFYKDDPAGHIDYDLQFAVPPGATTSPRLPVDRSLGSVGYDAVKGALGGTLKLSAKAIVGVRIGRFQERVWFVGKGIGAKVRL
ncbi:hypothetical protein BJ546DRAFT_971070 [Cryomyces antarcticus]